MQIPASNRLVNILNYFKGIPCSAFHRSGNFLVTATSRLHSRLCLRHRPPTMYHKAEDLPQ